MTKTCSSKTITKIAKESFQCDSNHGFGLCFGVGPATVAAVFNMLDLPDDSAEPSHLLLMLNQLTARKNIGGSPLELPPPEELPHEIIQTCFEAIWKIYDDDFLPPTPELPKRANVDSLLLEMGVRLHCPNRLRRKVAGRKVYAVLSVLKHLDSQRQDSPSDFDLDKIAGRWGVLNTDNWDEGLVELMKIIAFMEHMESLSEEPASNLSAAAFEEEWAILIGNNEDSFESMFDLHPGLCAEIWNRTLPFNSKPKHLLATLITLQAKNDSPYYFAQGPRNLEEKWMQRVLCAISAHYDATVEKMSTSGVRTDHASLSTEWGIMKHKESLGDLKVFRSIIVLNWMASEWEISNASK